MNEQYVSALADLFLPQRCVGCDGLSSGLPCRDCSEALPRAGRPVCARGGMPTAFEAFVCGACRGLDFGLESARVSLRYESVGEEIVPALKYRGYAKVLERVQPGGALLARGVAAGLDTPAFDTLEAVRRIRDQVELTAAERRANVEEAYAIRAACGAGPSSSTTPVFTTGATMSSCTETLLRGEVQEEVYAVSLCRTE